MLLIWIDLNEFFKTRLSKTKGYMTIQIPTTQTLKKLLIE